MRRGFSLTEMMTLGLLGLIVIGLVVSLLSGAYRQDSWTGERLDAVASLGVTIDAMRRDLYRSIAGRTVPQRNAIALLLSTHGEDEPDEATYTWAGPGKPLTRNGDAIGFAKPADFGVKVTGNTAMMQVIVPSGMLGTETPKHLTTVTVPMVVPDAYWRGRLFFFNGRPRATTDDTSPVE
jgi:hypothetical protein